MAVPAPRCIRAPVSIQGGAWNSYLGAGAGANASCFGRSGQAMNTTPIDAIAKAVLYEGYMLYPYRPSSVKNRQRFNFGVRYPRPYSEAQSGSDAWHMQTECLVQGGSG